MIKIEPRNRCKDFMFDSNIESRKGGAERLPELLNKAEFDKYCDANKFINGPFLETFGSGYGESYNPYRQAFGKLEDGRLVYCELHSELQKRVELKIANVKNDKEDA